MEFNFFYRCSFDWNFSGLFASRDGAMGKPDRPAPARFFSCYG